MQVISWSIALMSFFIKFMNNYIIIIAINNHILMNSSTFLYQIIYFLLKNLPFPELLGTVDFVASDGTIVFRTCKEEKDRIILQMVLFSSAIIKHFSREMVAILEYFNTIFVFTYISGNI